MARKIYASDWSSRFHGSAEDKMKKVFILAVLLLGVLSPFCPAQDKPKPEDSQKAEVRTTPVKVQIVFTEFEGDKKMKSLPYTLYINAPDAPEWKSSSFVKLRVGSRVPVYTGGTTGSMTYLDVGTNIDTRAAYSGDGRLLLQLNMERSWVEGDVSVPVAKSEGSATETSSGHFREPIIRNFRSELDVKLREGQSIESTMATDPLSGKVIKIDVSFTIVK
jgi:hypothetical protein